MADRYTKIVLTVIAFALSALAIEQATPPARAQMISGGASCGLTASSACFLREPVHVILLKP